MTDVRVNAEHADVLVLPSNPNVQVNEVMAESLMLPTEAKAQLNATMAESLVLPTTGKLQANALILEVLFAEISPPNSPIGLSAYDVTGNSANLIWEASPEGEQPSSYEYSMNNGTPVNVALNNVVSFSNLLPSSTYSFRVRTLGAQDASSWSTLEFTTTAGNPAKPVNVSVSNVTDSAGQASWQAGSGGAATLSYEYIVGGRSPVNVGLSTSASFSGLTPDTDHTFRVRAVGEFGVSEWTDASFRTFGPPPAPTSLNVANITDSSANFTWSHTSAATGFRYIINGGEPITIGVSQPLVVSGLTQQSQHSFSIQATNVYGSSGWVSTTFETAMGIPNAPVNLSISTYTTTSVTANWSPPTSGASPTSYDYSIDGGAWVSLLDASTSLTLENLNPGSAYSLRIRSKNSVGVSSEWASLNFTMSPGSPDAPINLSAFGITDTEARVKWTQAITGPVVHRYEYSLNYSEVLDAGQIVQVVFESLQPFSTHIFRVRGVGEFGTSEWATVTFTTKVSSVPEDPSLKIQWGALGNRIYENGLDRGVLYLSDNSGVAWNGLTALDEDLGEESTEPLYFDGEKIADSISMGDFSGTLRAIVYPDEFMEYEGFSEIGSGVYADDQRVNVFGLSYRTLIGNDVLDDDFGHKIHIVYNLTATPDARSHTTLSPSISLSEFGWTIQAVPEDVPGYRPTSHVIIDTRYMHRLIRRDIEDILYGSQESVARLPSISELVELVENFEFIRIVNNGDGTWTARGPSDLIQMTDSTTFVIHESNAVFLDENTYEISDS